MMIKAFNPPPLLESRKLLCTANHYCAPPISQFQVYT